MSQLLESRWSETKEALLEGLQGTKRSVMATTRGIADNVGGRPADPLKQLTPVTPIFAESQKRTEPIQAGIDMGDGVGSSALLMKKTSVKTSDTLAPLLPFDTTGEIGILYQDALSRGD